MNIKECLHQVRPYDSQKKVFALAQLLFICSVALGCARPIYETRQTDPSSGGQTKPDSSECMLVFSNSVYCLDIQWKTEPTRPGERLALIFKTSRPNSYDKSKVLEDLPGEAKVYLWMPDMNHGSAKVRLQKLDVGTYEASNVMFIMRGFWQIHFQYQDSGGMHEAIVDYNL
ncbi:MAG: hypothetical protein COT74_02050 [Bdellovibrionales bacterium CG10_big_fil_rev_8_21_14_0_10_45_34]|nr:MAG: hypothetical protein COT74_02050 [Bdellovibrionales bacterium CG10_big_fil_rev_8_21_14_0_10_45_34]